jgi:hypothetical protein
MAIRALARSVAAIPGPAERSFASRLLVHGLRPTTVAQGLWEEALFRLGDGAAPAVGVLLAEGDGPTGQRVAALNTAGRLKLVELADAVVGQLDADAPDVRAAALRCLAAWDQLPPWSQGKVLAALEDPHEGVRVQATHAAGLLPADLACTRLLVQLADASWAVRRAAGRSFLRVGPAGRTLLEHVARSQWDDFARDMAVHVLSDVRDGPAAESSAPSVAA